MPSRSWAEAARCRLRTTSAGEPGGGKDSSITCPPFVLPRTDAPIGAPPARGSRALSEGGGDGVAKCALIARELVRPVIDDLFADEVPIGVDRLHDRRVSVVFQQDAAVGGVDAHVSSREGV